MLTDECDGVVDTRRLSNCLHSHVPQQINHGVKPQRMGVQENRGLTTHYQHLPERAAFR